MASLLLDGTRASNAFKRGAQVLASLRAAIFALVSLL